MKNTVSSVSVLSAFTPLVSLYREYQFLHSLHKNLISHVLWPEALEIEETLMSLIKEPQTGVKNSSRKFSSRIEITGGDHLSEACLALRPTEKSGFFS